MTSSATTFSTPTALPLSSARKDEAECRNIGIYPSDRRLNIRQHGNSLLFADIR